MADGFSRLLFARFRRRLLQTLDHERALRAEVLVAGERLVDTIESITDGFFAIDRRWRFVYVNRRAEVLVAKSRDQLLGRTLWEEFPHMVGGTWEEVFRRAMSERITMHAEGYSERLSTWFDARAYPSREGITLYLTDITERKQAEQTLAARLRQQAAVAELGQRSLEGVGLQSLLDEAVALVAASLEVEMVTVQELLPGGASLRLVARSGWSEGDIGHPVEDCGTESQAGYTLLCGEPVICMDLGAETRFRSCPLLLQLGLRSGVSVVIRCRSQSYGVLGAYSMRRRELTADDIHFMQAVAHVLAQSIDVRRAEEELRESEARFRELAENIREVFWVSDDEEHRVLYVSPAYQEIWGHSRESLYAAPDSWLDALHPEDRPRIEVVLRDPVLFSAGYEYRVLRPDGTLRWVQAQQFQVSGRGHRLVGIARDVTEQRRAEEHARRLDQERAAAEAAVHARDDVLGVVSHDLRSPLATIQMAAAIAQRSNLEQAALPQLEIVQRAAAHMKRLIEDLLDVTRIEAGRMSLSLASIDVCGLLHSACEAVQAVAAAKHIEVTCHFVGDLQVLADRDRIIQVLSNLAGNAIKFTPCRGRVFLDAQQREEEVWISVSDTGPGIPPEQIPRLFEPFWQARPADRGGVGLGLAIVKGIVEAHGGRVMVQSEVGSGSSFHFTLRRGERC